jgi:hypothetical protein
MTEEIKSEELERKYAAGERDFTYLEWLTCDASGLNLRDVNLSNIYFDQFFGLDFSDFEVAASGHQVKLEYSCLSVGKS